MTWPARYLELSNGQPVHGPGNVYIEDGFVLRGYSRTGDDPLEFAGPGEVLDCGPTARLVNTAASRRVRVRNLDQQTSAPADAAPPALPGGTPHVSDALSPARTERYRVARRPAHVRLARLLFDLAVAGDSEVVPALATQSELARAISASVASVENALRNFRGRRIVTTGPGHRQYTILDAARLCEIADLPAAAPAETHPTNEIASGRGIELH